MDIEELTKSQIVLLTLLVSFVTSIATGIVTVSLMDQAPPAVTQTINRVVEKTVERVVPAETQTASVITQEKTVVVREDELIAQAVRRGQVSFVQVVRVSGETKTPAAVGVALTDRMIATDGGALVTGGTYEVKRADGTYVPVTMGERSTTKPTILTTTTLAEGEAPTITAATVNTDALTLGQTLVVLTGLSELKITNGIITGLEKGSETGTSTPAQTFEANVDTKALSPGGVVINTDGAVIGMYTGTRFVTSAVLADALKGATTSTEPTTAPQGQNAAQ